MIVDEEVYLEHFGVKGMKWGVRNERKTSSNPRSSTVSGMSPDQLGLAIYGGIAVAAILARKTVMYRDSGRKDARKSGDKPFKQDLSLKKKMSVLSLHNKVVRPINPDYGQPGTKMNCRRATLAYEMRRRGNDVKATKSNYASGQTEKGLKTVIGNKKQRFESVWGERKISTVNGNSTPLQKSESIFKALATNPNGSRGELGLSWTMGGGHSLAWEIVNRKPVIFDTQNGKVYDSSTSFSSFTPVVLESAYTRLDNKPIDSEFIRRWVTNV